METEIIHNLKKKKKSKQFLRIFLFFVFIYWKVAFWWYKVLSWPPWFHAPDVSSAFRWNTTVGWAAEVNTDVFVSV